MKEGLLASTWSPDERARPSKGARLSAPTNSSRAGYPLQRQPVQDRHRTAVRLEPRAVLSHQHIHGTGIPQAVEEKRIAMLEGPGRRPIPRGRLCAPLPLWSTEGGVEGLNVGDPRGGAVKDLNPLPDIERAPRPRSRERGSGALLRDAGKSPGLRVQMRVLWPFRRAIRPEFHVFFPKEPASTPTQPATITFTTDYSGAGLLEEKTIITLFLTVFFVNCVG